MTIEHNDELAGASIVQVDLRDCPAVPVLDMDNLYDWEEALGKMKVSELGDNAKVINELYRAIKKTYFILEGIGTPIVLDLDTV